ncbi:MAG: T9SS type A sorting domain-containing protein [Calditrichales bacterium]|nr:T9SS type A sorting domain-containing protein [Calditrichales bacterium]
MNHKTTTLFFGVLFFLVCSLSAQSMRTAMQYSFPVEAQDTVLCGLKSIRNIQYHPDPLGDGAAAFIATNYAQGGCVSVFKSAGNDSIELVWTSPLVDSLGGFSTPRYAIWGDLDNDGIIEIIFQNNLNGIFIYEWDGLPGSWNFGDAPAKVIGYPDITSASYGYSEYIHGVEDIDGDNVNELFLAINSSGSDNDRYYIFNITGNYQTGDPGFSVVNKEAEFRKNAVPYSKYGGGTPWAAFAANLDGEGNKELVFHNWNYGHVTTLTIPDADTYLLADTTNDKHYYYSTGIGNDNIAYMGGFVFDIDKDGREEVYVPFFYPYPTYGLVAMVHYEAGQNLREIDSSNVILFDISEVNNGNIFGYGYGDYDGDGKPNLYFSGGYGKLVTTAEFQGGDKTDQNNWTVEKLYEGDSTIFTALTIIDSSGILDSTYTIDISFVAKLGARYTDIDKDGFEDMFLPFQAMEDSMDINTYTWLNDTSYVVYDTLYPGTDSTRIDTNYFDYSIYDTLETKVINPKRWSIRMLESTVPNGVKAKDFAIITPDQYVLEQNYPNPFNPTTSIKFYLPINKKISLTIYNTLGQKVKTLINNEMIKRGSHLKEWDSTNSAGVKVASGMYIYELKFGNFTLSKRMMLLK